MKKEYHIKIYSIGKFIISFSVALSLLIIVLKNYISPIDNKFFSLLLFIGIFAISFYIALLAGSAKVIIIFTEEAFIHIWEKKFLFSRERNIKILWGNIKNYVFEEDRNFDSFIINLTTNQRYKINKQTIIPVKDDFDKLVKNFPKFANEYRKKNVSENNIVMGDYAPLIQKGESFYESKSFRWVFYFFAICFFVLLLMKILDPESGIWWGSLGVIGSGLLFYGFRASKK